MYITGDQSSFSSRQHQLSLISGEGSTMMEDINNYIIEGQTYIAAGTITPQESGKMEKEIRYNIYRLSGTADSLTTQRL